MSLAFNSSVTSFSNCKANGNKIMVRDVAEQHVIDDMGTIPTVQDYLKDLPMYDWLGGPKRRPKKTFHLDFNADTDTAEIVKPTPPTASMRLSLLCTAILAKFSVNSFELSRISWLLSCGSVFCKMSPVLLIVIDDA